MILVFNCLLFRDAEDAVRSRDGYDYDGYRLRVEFPKGGGSSFRGGRSAGRGPPARRLVQPPSPKMLQRPSKEIKIKIGSVSNSLGRIGR